MKEETILERVKELLELEDKDSVFDSKIQGYIDLFCDKVKSICKRKDFPQELNYMCIEFAKNSYLYYKDKDDSSNEQLQVTSASDNGQSVNFKTIETITKDDVDLDKVIAKNMAEISNYAYMEWRI